MPSLESMPQRGGCLPRRQIVEDLAEFDSARIMTDDHGTVASVTKRLSGQIILKNVAAAFASQGMTDGPSCTARVDDGRSGLVLDERPVQAGRVLYRLRKALNFASPAHDA